MLLTNQPTTDHPVKVAVIDSGIDPTHKKIGAVHEVLLDSVPPQDTHSAGHGTACAGIIRQIAPTAALYDVRIFDKSLTADPRSLLAAIRWTIEHQMDVVNLSLGTADVTFRDALADLCCKPATPALLSLPPSSTTSAKATRPSCQMSSVSPEVKCAVAMGITTVRATLSNASPAAMTSAYAGPILRIG